MLRVLGRPEVAGGVAMSALAGMGAMTLLTFAVPFLTDAGVPSAAVTVVLLGYGAGCLLGNAAGARLADRGLSTALTITLTGTATALLVAAAVAGYGWASAAGLAVVGFAYFATFPLLNTWVATRSAGLSPSLGLAVNSSAFNVGIAVDGWVGGVGASAR